MTEQAIDGRIARRQRNLDAVLDVVLEMFAEDMMFPSIEQASKRSGLSMRSLYRYFADPAELVEAAIKRSQAQAAELTHLARIGQGPFADRLDDFVSMRLRLYEANRGHVPCHDPQCGESAHACATRWLRTGGSSAISSCSSSVPELAALSPRARASAVEAGNVLTQIDSIDLLRRGRNLTVAETDTILRDSLTALLVPHPDDDDIVACHGRSSSLPWFCPLKSIRSASGNRSMPSMMCSRCRSDPSATHADRSANASGMRWK